MILTRLARFARRLPLLRLILPVWACCAFGQPGGVGKGAGCARGAVSGAHSVREGAGGAGNAGGGLGGGLVVAGGAGNGRELAAEAAIN